MNFKKLLALVLPTILLLISTACTKHPNMAVTSDPGEKVLYRSHDPRPEWTLIENAEQGAFFYATGVSDRFSTELDARDHALFRARQEIADYVLNFVAKDRSETRKDDNSSGKDRNLQIESSNSARATVQVAVSQVRPKSWYLEKVQTENAKILWQAFVLVEAPREAVQREITRTARATNAYETQNPTYSLNANELAVVHTAAPKF